MARPKSAPSKDKQQTAPYGSWKSPITADLVGSSFVTFSVLTPVREDLYYVERRPSEKGRQVLMRCTPDGETQEITPAPYNVRSRVHEYGGRSYAVAADGTVVFSNFSDQYMYILHPGQEPQHLTHDGAFFYADQRIDSSRGRVICIQEDHSQPGEAKNSLVSLSLNGGENRLTLAEGNDFYASPALSPDGKSLAWLTWNHPNMPWDGTELWVGELDARGALISSRKVAGGEAESVFQPSWSPDGRLYFVSDPQGWWNLYRWNGDGLQALLPMEAEFGQPLWVFDMSTYGFLTADRILCTYTLQGVSYLGELNVESRQFRKITTPYTGISDLRVTSRQVYFIGVSPQEPPAIVSFDPRRHTTQRLVVSGEINVNPGYLSLPETIEFPTEGGQTAFGLFYPPVNPGFRGPEGEKPPLIVMSHGGPTGKSAPALNLEIQFWTSRGFGVLDVNYGGSTGYGRAYRERLKGNWGVVDIDDCVNGARYLAEQGQVDGERLAIRGGSAGGFTTLGALTFRDTFKAGASYYGIGDLIALETDSHKFESRYNHSLVGPYPEREDLYKERSAIYHTDLLKTPMILFQGLEDLVVPPNQSQMMFDAVKAKGLPVAYLAFEGEQHGFRQAETIRRSLEAEYYFYSKVFGFEPSDEIEPVKIENL